MPFTVAVNKILEELKKREDFVGLIGFGSHYEQKRTPGPDSDIDLIALVTSPTLETHVVVVEGFEAEVFVRNCYMVLNNILEKDNDFEVRNIGAGRLIYSSDPIVQWIKELATEKYTKLGSSPFHTASLFFRRVEYADLMERTRSPELREEERLFLMDWVFEQIMSDWFRFKRLYVEKFSYHLRDIEEHDPTMVALCKHYLASAEGDARLRVLEAIIAHCLALVGGLPPSQWEVCWDPVQVKAAEAAVQNNDGHLRQR